MTTRERCLNILHYKNADRLPAIHFGYWAQLLDEWVEQGKISRSIADGARWDSSPEQRELDKLLGFEGNWNNNVGYNEGLYPAFETKVLEVLPDGSQRVITPFGTIERIKPGIVSIPSEDDYLLKDRDAFEEMFRHRMQYCEERVDVEAAKLKHAHLSDGGEMPVGIYLGAVMGRIRDLATVVGMSYLMYDEDEDLFADIVDTFAEMQYRCVEKLRSIGLRFDFAHYWEDICFKSGPLLSPEIFNELCAKHYKKRNDLCAKHGIDLVSLDCDGVIDKLIPTWLENGVNVMFPLEIGVWGDQFEAARAKYGEKLLAVGGMDKTAFRKDKAAVDAELERLKRLAAMGGFIPCPDHRIMPGSSFELVQYYTEELKKIRL